MITGISTAAVYAGLLGNAGLATTAGKVVGSGLDLSGLSTLQLFGIGCLGGALVSGIAVVIVSALTRRRETREEGGEHEGRDLETLAATGQIPAFLLKPLPTIEAGAGEGSERTAKPAGRHMRQAAEAPQSAPAPAPVAESTSRGSHVASDLDDIAENYVKKHSLRERMAARAAGVASVLSDRLGRDMFDDLPVIERADGTVGDVGTSWWDNALGSSVLRTGAIMEDTRPQPAIGSTPQAAPQPQQQAWSAETMPFTPAMAASAAAPVTQAPAMTPAAASLGREEPFNRVRAERRARAMAIARSVAEIDLGVYPEQRDVAELDSDDLWEVALKAMSERIAQQASDPVFVDGASAPGAVAQQAGPEEATGFIPFKRPAGHPEVVDTESYVDYLIEEEFSQNGSTAARRTSRDYLRLIQGGSQKSRPLPVQPEKPAYVPKHFAPAKSELLAREA